jgi:hypothetical protein
VIVLRLNVKYNQAWYTSGRVYEVMWFSLVQGRDGNNFKVT